MAAIKLDRVEKVYPNGHVAARELNLEIADGEFLVLVGPSGCGKSTALRMVAGLETPTRGEVTRAPGRGETSVVFQAPPLAPWLTAQANVALPLELSGAPAAAARADAVEALCAVGLAEAVAARPAQLSGGMAMRVSLARSLTLQPRVFLFDEPFGALDEITRERLQDELLGLFVRQGFAGLFVTHSTFEAVFLATRVLVLSARPGRVVGCTISALRSGTVSTSCAKPNANWKPRECPSMA